MSTVPKAIHRISAILKKILMAFFAEIEISILKFIWSLKRSQIAKTILKEENKVGGLTLPNFKTHYKAAIIKTVLYQQKEGHIDRQWNR